MLWIMEFTISKKGTLSPSASSAGIWEQTIALILLPIAAAAFLWLTVSFPNKLLAKDIQFSRRFMPGRWLRKVFLSPKAVWGATAFIVGSQIIVRLIMDIKGIYGINDASPALGFAWIMSNFYAVGFFMILAMILGIRNLFQGYRLADSSDRRHLLWLITGIVISTFMILVPLVSMPILATHPDMVWIENLVLISISLAPAVLVAAIAMAIFYTGSIDPSLVLARSTISGILSTLWIAFYAAIESLFSSWLQKALNLPAPLVSALIALAAAAIALPLRKMILPLSARIKQSSDLPESIQEG